MNWRAHEDSAHGLTVHPCLPLIATTSGQRRIFPPKFIHKNSDSDSDNSLDFTEVAHLTDEQVSQLPELCRGDLDDHINLPYYGQLDTLPNENCLKLWSFLLKNV